MTDSLDQLFSTWVVRFPDRKWLKYNHLSYSYAEIDEQVAQLIDQLTASGLQPGDRVAIYMAKTPNMVVALLACSRMRLVSVPIHMVLKSSQVNYILNDSSAAALLIDDKRRAYVDSNVSSSYLRQLICFHDADNGFVCVSYNSSGQVEKLPERFSQAELLIYTSGSTGKPKGVVVSGSNIRKGAESVSEYLGLNMDDRILSLLPFAFDYGFNQLTSSLVSGAVLVLMDYMFVADVVRQVQLHNITVIAGVPPLWFKLLRANWDDGAGESLRLLTNSGGRLPRAVQESLLNTFSRAELVLMYGLTEAFRSTYLPAAMRDNNSNSIGQPIPSAELFVINERGEQAEVGEHGELVHCGPLVALGYWGSAQLSHSCFKKPPIQSVLKSESGMAVWSGDQVYQDENGLYYFVGREDGLIKSSGYRISPEEIEEAAYSLEGVDEAVAFGVDDDELGQRIVMVVSKSGRGLTETVIRQKMRVMLPEYMVPHQFIFQNEFPRTPSGKFDRVAIKAQIV